MGDGMKKIETYRVIEVGVLILFICFSLAIIFLNPSGGQSANNIPEMQTEIDVYASAMPHQGWSPMKVYYSAFGSQSLAGDIIQYGSDTGFTA